MTPDPSARIAEALRDRYRVEGSLGEGGTSVVYLATDLKHDRKVALKVLRPELTALVGADRFVAEIRTTANLQHPHILPLFDSGEVEGTPFYVMPWVEGESLRERLDREGALPVEEALAIARDVAAALGYAHERGIVHRDVKPGNVLLSDGEALVADFGIALALSEVGPERRTATGMSVGTPWYMSPEQIEGDAPVDARSDVYALGCLVFEMLTGKRPFEGSSLTAVVARILTETPPAVHTLNPEVPESVSRAVARALEKEPGRRFGSVGEFARALRLEAGVVGARGRGPGLLPAAVLGVLLVLGGVLGWRALQRASARASLGEIQRLVDDGRYVEGYAAAREAERWIPEDSTLQGLLRASSTVLEVRTDPPGAQVWLQRFERGAEQTAGEEQVGTTPLSGFRIPREDHRLVLRSPGFVPSERMVSSELTRELLGEEEGRTFRVEVALSPEAETPPGTVRVPGGEYQLASPDAPTQESVVLEPFHIHRYEVSNEDFAAFVRGGGYGRDQLWEGVPEETRGRLTDRTGLPGPRGWSRQRFPEGGERLPVTGVTWWEAQAYCLQQGARLPTIYEWEKTARAGVRARLGVFMPWGLQVATGGARRANFSSDGPVAVDAFPFGVSPFGAYGMAGNVSEWTLNPSRGGRVVTGGSWAGPSYLYTEYSSEDPGFTASSLGFRCVHPLGSGTQGGEDIDLEPEPPDWTPVDRAGFTSLLEFYRYDPVPANPRRRQVEEAPDWTRERLWIDGPGGDSILLYLWTPRVGEPPYQTVAYVPGSSAFYDESVPDAVESRIGPVIQGGRAAVATVFYGMTERPAPQGAAFPPPPSVGFRDLMVRHATELRLTLDYAQTREEVDGDALAYLGLSWGAGSRLAFAAVDDRYRAAVLVGAGIDERVKPTLPEADNVNFAPYISAPTLMLNGTNDEEHPWGSRARPLWELLSEPKELVLVEGAGHLPPVEDRIPAINDFLDRVLGPVR